MTADSFSFGPAGPELRNQDGSTQGRAIPRRWSASEAALLVAMYPHCHTADVAAWIGRTLHQTYRAAGWRDLHKTPEYLASDTACRVRRGHQNANMIGSRFKPGQPAWNRGLKGVVGVQPECRATQFKLGHKPQTWVPVGSYRIADGVLQQKMNDLPGPSNVRWTPVARLVWEARHGAIPPGHVVRFKTGSHTTELALITLDRLECVSRVENMRRNSVHTKYPPEVARLVQLRGALNRQINARNRAQEEA